MGCKRHRKPTDVLEMSYGGRGTRRGRVEEENNQNYRKLNQNYQKFILFNDNSNNFRSHQLPRATREIFIKQKYGSLKPTKIWRLCRSLEDAR